MLKDFENIIYKDGSNDVKVSVMLINNDLWLTQDLIAELFGTARSTITEHINNILNEVKNINYEAEVLNETDKIKYYTQSPLVSQDLLSHLQSRLLDS